MKMKKGNKNYVILNSFQNLISKRPCDPEINSGRRAKKGFTLAEVLITLGIIGVVAALTIPSLIANYQKTQYVTGLKKAYLNLTEVLQEIMLDEGITEFNQLSLFDGVDFTDSNKQNTVDALIKKHFKVGKSCKADDASCTINGYQAIGGSDRNVSMFTTTGYNFQTLDEIYYRMRIESTCIPDSSKIGKMKANCGNIWLDINGAKYPNVVGRDVFLFWIGQDGNLYPAGGPEVAKFACGTTWQTCASHWPTAGTAFDGCSPEVTDSTGNGCSGRIMEDSWQMNY